MAHPVAKLLSVLALISYSAVGALAVTPEHAPEFETGCKQMQDKEFDQAITSLNVAIAAKPDDALAIFRRGQCYYCLEHIVEALKDFNRCISLENGVSHFYLWRGTAEARIGNDPAAVDDYQRAMRLDPALIFAYTRALLRRQAESAPPAPPAAPGSPAGHSTGATPPAEAEKAQAYGTASPNSTSSAGADASTSSSAAGLITGTSISSKAGASTSSSSTGSSAGKPGSSSASGGDISERSSSAPSTSAPSENKTELGQFKVVGPSDWAHMQQRRIAITDNTGSGHGKTIELGFSANAISDYKQAIELILSRGRADEEMYADIAAVRPGVLRSPRP